MNGGIPTSSEKLVEAIQDGLNNNIILPGRVAAKLAAKLDQKPVTESAPGDFTPRELEIVCLLMKGMNN